MEMKLDRYVCPLRGSPFIIPGNPGCWDGGMRPLWTAATERRRNRSDHFSLTVSLDICTADMHTNIYEYT